MKRLRTAVIGTGHLGRFHAQKYAMLPEAELVAVVDLNESSAREAAAGTNAAVHTSYAALFGKVDAVSVVTPTESHFKIASEFLGRGVDVLVEKPMTMTGAEADALIRAADSSGAILQVGHLERFNPAVIALKGRLDGPLLIDAQRLSPFPNRSTDVDVVLDVMIHDIDIILNLVPSPVESVDAVGVPVVTDKIDVASARIKFENGCVANVTASRASKERVRKTRIYQRDEHVTIDYAAQQISITRAVKAEPRAAFKELVDEELALERKDTLLEEIRSFVDCSLRRGVPAVSGRDGKRALDVAELVQASLKRSMEKAGAIPRA